MNGKITTLLVLLIVYVKCSDAGPVSDQSLESKVNQLEEIFKKIVKERNTCDEKYRSLQYDLGNSGGDTPIEADTEHKEENDFTALFLDMKTQLKPQNVEKQTKNGNYFSKFFTKIMNFFGLKKN